MAILHVKTPNGTTKDIDLYKIVLTDGKQDTPVNTIPIGSSLRFGDRGFIEYRDTNHYDLTRLLYQLSIGNEITNWDGPGAKAVFHDYREVDGEQLGGCDGGFSIRAVDNNNHYELSLMPTTGHIYWRGSTSLTDGTFIKTNYVNIETSSGKYAYSISAPAMSGYKFVSWVGQASTNGFVSAGYVESAWSANTTCWIKDPQENMHIICIAIYIRQW